MLKRVLSIMLCIAVALTFSSCTFGETSSTYYDEVVLTYQEEVQNNNSYDGTVTELPDDTVTEIVSSFSGFTENSASSDSDESKESSKNSSSKNNTASSSKAQASSSKVETTSSTVSSEPDREYTEEEWRLHPEDFKLLCLTFDDGSAYPTYNEDDPAIKIAEIVKQYHGSATYFYTGSAMRADVDVAEWLVDNGFEIGNHSNGHITFTPYTDVATCESQVLTVNEHFKEKLDIDIKYFRGAGFSSCGNLRSVLSRYEMPYIAYWKAIEDWPGGNGTKESVKNALLNGATDGGIMAMHATNKNNITPDALAEVLPVLYEQGYRFCSVDELFKLRNVKTIPYGKEIRRVTPEGVVVTF